MSPLTQTKKKINTKSAKPKNEKSPTNDKIKDEIIRHIYEIMGGQPFNLYKADVKHLWDNNYRVNLWCDKTSDSIVPQKYIKYSYFVVYRENCIEIRKNKNE